MYFSLLPLLTAFGLGSVVTVVIQFWFKRRENLETRNFKERKRAYIGLLEAYYEAAVKSTDASAKKFGYWQIRCDLVSPRIVREAILKMAKTRSNSTARKETMDELKMVIRSDLGVSKS